MRYANLDFSKPSNLCLQLLRIKRNKCLIHELPSDKLIYHRLIRLIQWFTVPSRKRAWLCLLGYTVVVWIDGKKFTRRNSRSEIIGRVVTKKSSARVIVPRLVRYEAPSRRMRNQRVIRKYKEPPRRMQRNAMQVEFRLISAADSPRSQRRFNLFASFPSQLFITFLFSYQDSIVMPILSFFASSL